MAIASVTGTTWAALSSMLGTAKASIKNIIGIIAEIIVPVYGLPTSASMAITTAYQCIGRGNKICTIINGYFKVYDVTNPLSPTLLGEVAHGWSNGELHPISWSSSDTVLVIRWTGYPGSVSYGSVVDVSNPAAPTIKGTVQIRASNSTLSYFTTPVDSNGYAYIQDQGNMNPGECHIVNFNDPNAPVKVSTFSLGGMVYNEGAYGGCIEGNYYYAVLCEAKTLRIFNISNPAAVTVVGSCSFPNRVRSAPFKFGNYIYVWTEASSLAAVNVSNPAAPSQVATVTGLSGIHWMVKMFGNLYGNIEGGSGVFKQFSLTNPASPTLLGSSTVTPPAGYSGMYLRPYIYGFHQVGDYVIQGSFLSPTNGIITMKFPVV